MTIQLNPLAITDQVRASYLRYLKTIYPLQDDELRQQFSTALEQDGFLVKGPLLQAAPPHKTGETIAQLMDRGVLHTGFRRLCNPALPLDRPLYEHQQRAIEKIRAGRNIVVATGTGSGKTESFLIPILDHLLREQTGRTLEQPGVRALLLYPMNALANDQLKRLRQMLSHYPAITFGRYTGETPNSRQDAEKQYRQQHGGDPLPNELISRDQIQAAPPHILMTNYAMLEYLLLRPSDTTLFDGPTGRFWRFLVVDEAHVYDGAQGIEIAMLVRRLKDRVVGSEPGRIRAIATSATLGSGENDFPAVVGFANQLFGESFEWFSEDAERQDVVPAVPAELTLDAAGWGKGKPELYRALALELDDRARPIDVARLEAIALEHGVPAGVARAAQRAAGSAAPDASAEVFLHDLLRGDQRLADLRQVLAEDTGTLQDFARSTFGEATDSAAEHVVELVSLAVRARVSPEHVPLLPARYHVFARALEGAYVCLNRDHAAHRTAGQPRLFLHREETCPHCQSRVFEIGACPRCGTHYLVGELAPLDQGGSGTMRFKQMSGPVPIDESRKAPVYFLIGRVATSVDEDEEVAGDGDMHAIGSATPTEEMSLCLSCGAVAHGANAQLPCHCGPQAPRINVIHIHLQKQEQELRRCATCGTRNPAGAVYRFLPGQDAPASVLATALYQQLPPARAEESRHQPGGGRKLLIFADSRQDAAFFAPYLERTYEGLLRRRLIYKSVIEDNAGRRGELRLSDTARRVLKQAQGIDLFSPGESQDTKRTRILTWLMLELLAMDRRLSLEGLGLVRFRLVEPDTWEPPQPLLYAPWLLSRPEAWSVCALLLDTLRVQGAVTFPDDPPVDPSQPDFLPRNFAFYFKEGDANESKHLYGWLPSGGSNRRQDVLKRILLRGGGLVEPLDVDRTVLEVLKELWKHFTQDRAWHWHVISNNVQSITGPVYRISYDMFELVPNTAEGFAVYQCSRCNNLAYENVRGVCPTYQCDGTLELVTDQVKLGQDNHYRYLYDHLIPIPLSAKEHTAQWTNIQAAEVQNEFIRGEVNALSCSTTFELGVDVGDLQAVLMRNVPPTTANYVQRAGRVGRRTDSAAYALTYAQRRSHDLTHFNHPKRMVSGKVQPPRVRLSNAKIIRRHMHSVLFAAFLRWARDTQGVSFGQGNSLRLGEFFMPQPGQPSGPDLLSRFVKDRPAVVQEALGRILPASDSLRHQLGFPNWAWLGELWADGSGLFERVVQEVGEQLSLLDQLASDAATRKEYRAAEYFQSIGKTVRSRDLLGFLGSRSVLPKYGFPTDVVDLQTSHLAQPAEANQIELQRDLRVAISEYAPGGQVVAAKYVWTSGGIRKPPGRGWESGNYAVCHECGRFHRSMTAPIDTCAACGCNIRQSRRAMKGEYLIPEFGFVAARDPKPAGNARPERIYASQVFFSEYSGADHEVLLEPPERLLCEPISSNGIQVYQRYSRFGWLAVVNPGLMRRGFRVCMSCGKAEPVKFAAVGTRRAPAATHKNPQTGRDCSGRFATRHLLHEFMTDVLELQFEGLGVPGNQEEIWRSTLYALLEGASESLGIRRDDLDGTLYYHASGQAPSLVLFDNVPGGAGHVERVAQALPDVFRVALERMKFECCGDNTSCYDCLRNFRNQPYHEVLKRTTARDLLLRVLD